MLVVRPYQVFWLGKSLNVLLLIPLGLKLMPSVELVHSKGPTLPVCITEMALPAQTVSAYKVKLPACGMANTVTSTGMASSGPH